jgi:hypothetical protein
MWKRHLYLGLWTVAQYCTQLSKYVEVNCPLLLIILPSYSSFVGFCFIICSSVQIGVNLQRQLCLWTRPYWIETLKLKKKTKLHGLSPRANYTDRATAACRRSDCQLLRIKVPRGQRDGSLRPYSRFSRQEPLLFYQVAAQLYSRRWVDPVPDPLIFFSGSAGNRTRASGSVAKNSDH